MRELETSLQQFGEFLLRARLVRIPEHREHRFRPIVNADSGIVNSDSGDPER